MQVYELLTCVRRANENAGNLISGVQFLINIYIYVCVCVCVCVCMAWLRCYHMRVTFEEAFQALPPSLHRHCTGEAQKAETVLSAVIYIYIYNCRQYCFDLLGLISAVLMSAMEVKLKKPTRVSHTCGNISAMPECSN